MDSAAQLAAFVATPETRPWADALAAALVPRLDDVPTRLADGTYDPFALAEQREVEHAREQRAAARAQWGQLAGRLIDEPRARPLIDCWIKALVEQYLEGNAVFVFGQFAAQLKLGERPLDGRVVLRDDQTLHLLESETGPSRRAVTTSHGRHHYHTRYVPSMTVAPRPLLPCEAQLGWWARRKARVLPLALQEIGVWGSYPSRHCPACATRATSQQAWVPAAWQPDEVRELVATAYVEVVEDLLASGEIPADLPAWEQAVRSQMGPAAGLALGRALLAHGDDVMVSTWGLQEWRVLRSALPDQTHRLVDLPDEDDWVKLGVLYDNSEYQTRYDREGEVLRAYLRGVFRHKMGLDTELSGDRNGIASSKLHQLITGQEHPADRRWRERMESLRAGQSPLAHTPKAAPRRRVTPNMRAQMRKGR